MRYKMSNKKEIIRKEDIINEMSERKDISKNRYLINVILQTKYYCFNLTPHKPYTLLIDRETKEFLRVDLKIFLEKEFYPLTLNIDDIKNIKKYFKITRYFGHNEDDFKEFENKFLKKLEDLNYPDLRDFYEVEE